MLLIDNRSGLPEEAGFKMQISATTRVCGTLANPNRRTTAPIMHNAGFDELGIDFRYLAFEPDDIGKAMAAIRVLKFVGVSVSKPYKQAVIPHLDELDDTARTIGAVNIVHNVDGNLKGYNSDWIGAVDALKEVCSLNGVRVAVLGAGGAARAVVYGLKRNECEVNIYSRSAEKGVALAESLGATFSGPIEEVAKTRPDVLVNATSIGSGTDDDVPVPDSVFETARTVMDIPVRLKKSVFLARAAKNGSSTISGVRMLVLQGAFTFQLFTGATPPVDVMQLAVERALGG